MDLAARQRLMGLAETSQVSRHSNLNAGGSVRQAGAAYWL